MESRREAVALGSQSLIGQNLCGRYQVQKKIGQGGMAWIFKAWDHQEEKPVALKVLLPHLAEDPQLHQRFLKETRIQAQLSHPNIVQLFGVYEDQGVTFMVLEWVPGESLRGMLERFPAPYPAQEIWWVMAPLLDGIGYAHQQQTIHRDLKPENFLLRWEKEAFQLKIADFGLAKILDAVEDNQTKTETMMGTIKYMSPEQVRDSKRVDHRADLYSLGICLYQLATGYLPFTGSMRSVMSRIMTQAPPPPLQKNPDLSPALNQIILQSIAKDPEARFQSCDDFRQALYDSLDMARLEAAGADHLRFLLPLPPPNEDHTEEVFVHSETLALEQSPPPALTDPAPIAPESGDTPLEWTQSDARQIIGKDPPLVKYATFTAGILFLIVASGAYLFFFADNPPPQRTPSPSSKSSPLLCSPKAKRSCYTGPPNTRNKGRCQDGTQSCSEGKWGPCQGERLPAPKESCNNQDDNCNGQVDESFANKGKTCTLREDECSYPGTWRCSPPGHKTLCQRNAKETRPTEQRLRLQFFPRETLFQLRLRRKKKVIKNSYCIAWKKGARQRILVKIKGRHYHRCWFSVRPGSSPLKILRLKLRRKKKHELEPRPDYCKRR